MKSELIDLGNVERIINLVADVASAENINLLEVMQACTALRASCAALIGDKMGGFEAAEKVTESNEDE